MNSIEGSCPPLTLTVDLTVLALQDRVFQFAEQTFGVGREDAAWKKLFEELGEVLKKPRDPAEWGDVFILLFDLASIYGVRVDLATVDKLQVISNRVWNRTETGTFQHVPGAVKPPQRYRHHAAYEGGPWAGGNDLDCSEPEPPSAFCPPGCDVPGCYVLERKDPGMSGRVVLVYKWDPDMEVPF